MVCGSHKGMNSYNDHAQSVNLMFERQITVNLERAVTKWPTLERAVTKWPTPSGAFLRKKSTTVELGRNNR